MAAINPNNQKLINDFHQQHAEKIEQSAYKSRIKESPLKPKYGEGITGYNLNLSIAQAMYLKDAHELLKHTKSQNTRAEMEQNMHAFMHIMESFLELFSEVESKNDPDLWK